MILRKFTSYLLITSYITQYCLPAFAMEKIDDSSHKYDHLKQGAVPAFLDEQARTGETAAGCIFYAQDGENTKILFGLRDDENTYTNPAGKSEKDDKCLFDTALSEGAQETLYIYCPHRDVLRIKPFVDLASYKNNSNSPTPQPFLTRTYFVEQEFVEAAVFNERLANPEKLGLPKSSLEFRRYQWVLVKDILDAIHLGKSTITMSDTGEVITLYAPLFQTLLAETSKNLLGQILKNKSIPTFPKKADPVFKNKVHLEGFPSINRKVKLSWYLPELNADEIAIDAIKRKEANLTTLISAKEVIEKGRDTFDKVVLAPLTTELIDFDQDAFGSKTGMLLMNCEQHLLMPYDYKRNRTIMGKAVAAKAAANLELKKLQFRSTQQKRRQLEKLHELDSEYFKAKKEQLGIRDSYHTVTLPQHYELKDVSPETETSSIISILEPDYTQPTLSDLLLQYQLGADYVHPENPYSQQSRLAAYAENLKRYHVKFSGDNGRELKRKSEPVSSDYLQLAQVMELVKQHKGWLPIHHASKGEVKFLWTASTSLFELLFLNSYPTGTLPVMRATDLYFKGHNTIAESVTKTGTEDYQKGNMNRRLCGNMCVTSGLTTTFTSSNSVEYFCNAHSVEMPSIPKKYQEGIELLGMVGVSYLPYQSIFEQFYGAVNTKYPNSAWTIVFVKPDALDKHAYPSHGGGSIFYADQPLSKDHGAYTIPSTKALYERAEYELESAVKVTSHESSSATTKRAESVAEIRVTLHPELMRDSTKTKVVSVDRSPLQEKKQNKFMQMLMACDINDAGQWLSSHTKLIPNSIDLGENKELPLKKLYALAHEGLTGMPVIETLSLDAFKHLIRNGQVEGAQQLFETFPDILQRVTYTPTELVNLAVVSGSVETLQFVLEKVMNTKVSKHFKKEDIIALVMACISTKKFEATHDYVLKSFDLSTIDKNLRREWAAKFMPLATKKEVKRIHNTLYPITMDVIEDAVKLVSQSNDYHSWKGLTKFKGISKAQIAEVFLAELSNGCSHNAAHHFRQVLIALLKDGLSYSELLPKSGNPLLFSLPYTLQDGTSKEAKQLISILINDTKLLDYRNSEGLSLFPYIQRRFMNEGVSMSYAFQDEVLKKQIAARKESSKPVECYGPFIEEFGDLDLF